MTADLVLLAFCLVVALFTGAAWCRLMVLLREDARERKAIDEWRAGRRRFRTQTDSSSLMDDSPQHADSGPKAA